MAAGYFDNNATTPVNKHVSQTLWDLRALFGNPSSSYQFGWESKERLQLARKQVADLIGAEPEEITFTSGGTESNNLAIKGFLNQLPEHGGHLITTSVEHPSVLEVIRYYENKFGYRCTYLSVNAEGIIDPEELEKEITEETRLISIMTANNEIGSIQPIREIAAIAKRRDIFFHTDAVQALGKLPVDVKELDVDALSLSGHKFSAPKGVGALYLRTGRSLTPLLHGGKQENGLRCGTENLMGIIGLGVACEQQMKTIGSDRKHYLELKELLVESLRNIKVNGSLDEANCLPNTLNLQCIGVRGELLTAYLNQNHAISLSIGSACSSNKQKNLSHVLQAIGLPEDEIRSSIRISFGKQTSRDDILFLAKVLNEAIDKFSNILPSKKV